MREYGVRYALLEEADGTYGLIASTLIHAAELIRNLETG